MLELVIIAAVSVASGAMAGFIAGRRRRPVPVPPAAELGRAVASYGEQLKELSFDPAAPDVVPAMLDDYRQALDAYDQAAEVADLGGTDAARNVHLAVQRGRNALIRLDARRRGVPVPLEAVAPEDLSESPPTSSAQPLQAGERYHYQGVGESEFMLDRPEPGKPTLLEITIEQGKAMFVRPVTRTEDGVKHHNAILASNISQALGPRRVLLPATGTHLRVEVYAHVSWSMRLRPLADIRVMGGSCRGAATMDVYAYHGDRVRVLVQARSGITVTWHGFCGCMNDCRCGASAPLYEARIQEEHDYRGPFTLRPGFLQIDANGPWAIDPLPPENAPAE